MPWPVGILAGIIGFILVRYGIQWFLSLQGGMLAQAFAQQSSPVFAPLAWMLLGICWIAALASYLNARKRRRFLDTRTTLESLAAGGWRQFEQLEAPTGWRQRGARDGRASCPPSSAGRNDCLYRHVHSRCGGLRQRKAH